MDVLFKTVHGSRLYGLARPDSDEDFYTVVSKVKTNRKKYARQSIVDNIDSTVVDFGTWLHFCEMGVPQALEAMFSSMAVEDHIAPLRAQYRAGTGVYDRYLRTIKTFAMRDTYKSKRHSLRLALNLQELRGSGRFNPTLSTEQKSWVSMFANMPDTHVYRLAKDVAWR